MQSSKSGCHETEQRCEHESRHTLFQQEKETSEGCSDDGERVDGAVTVLGEQGSDGSREETPLLSWAPQQSRGGGGGGGGGGEEGWGGGRLVSVIERIEERDEGEAVFDKVGLLSVLSHDLFNWVWE